MPKPTGRTVVWETVLAGAAGSLVIYAVFTCLAWLRVGRTHTPEAWPHVHLAALFFAGLVIIGYGHVVRYRKWCIIFEKLGRALEEDVGRERAN